MPPVFPRFSGKKKHRLMSKAVLVLPENVEKPAVNIFAAFACKRYQIGICVSHKKGSLYHWFLWAETSSTFGRDYASVPNRNFVWKKLGCIRVRPKETNQKCFENISVSLSLKRIHSKKITNLRLKKDFEKMPISYTDKDT